MDVSWIKIYIDWYDSRKIKYLRKLPKGNEYALLWIMVLSLAGKSNNGGKLTITDDLPYTLEDLSNELGFKAQIVKQGFSEFIKLGMVIQENDSYIIANWEEYQNIDGLEKIREQNRKRVANYRSRQKALMTSDRCQYCGAKASGYDHIIPLSKGGKDIDENKVPCCITCNRMKNDKPLVDFLNSNRDRINDEIVKENNILSKYVMLSNVTNRYIVTHCNAIDKEEEIDIEKDKELSKKELIRKRSTDPFYGRQ